MFGEDLESIEPEEKYEESIAERVKTKPRKQNASSSLPKKDQKKVKKDLVMIMISMDDLVDLGT